MHPKGFSRETDLTHRDCGSGDTRRELCFRERFPLPDREGPGRRVKVFGYPVVVGVDRSHRDSDAVSRTSLKVSWVPASDERPRGPLVPDRSDRDRVLCTDP